MRERFIFHSQPPPHNIFTWMMALLMCMIFNNAHHHRVQAVVCERSYYQNTDPAVALAEIASLGCTTIDGSLGFNGSPSDYDLTDLSGLASVTNITGDFGLYSSQVSDLSALSNLVAIGGRFVIWNSILTSFEGLDNLVSIGRGMDLQQNNNLISFQGLGSLRTIGADPTYSLIALNNINLATIDGMDSLSSMEGQIQSLNSAKKILTSMCMPCIVF